METGGRHGDSRSIIYLQMGTAPPSTPEPETVAKNVHCSFLEGSEDNGHDSLVKFSISGVQGFTRSLPLVSRAEGRFPLKSKPLQGC